MIITWLLLHFYKWKFGKLCSNDSIITYYAKSSLLRYHYTIITSLLENYVIITYYAKSRLLRHYCTVLLRHYYTGFYNYPLLPISVSQTCRWWSTNPRRGGSRRQPHVSVRAEVSMLWYIVTGGASAGKVKAA